LGGKIEKVKYEMNTGFPIKSGMTEGKENTGFPIKSGMTEWEERINKRIIPVR